MTKSKKIMAFAILLILFTSSCGGGNKNYIGGYPELYTEATQSLLGSRGFIGGEVFIQPDIKIIKEDTYGRKLFLYFEDNPVSYHSLLICQKSDEKYVYFYPDDNFISIDNESWDVSVDDFLQEDIEELKRKNDWGRKIDIDKCIKRKIVRQKEKGPVDGRAVKELYNKALGEDASSAYNGYTKYYGSDKYGRSIYLAYSRAIDRCVVMFFQPDSRYDESKCLMELSDFQNYQDELKEFKRINDWNQPIS